MYAPKTRTLAEIVNKNQHFKLPCIAISLGGISRNVNRVFNKLEGSNWCVNDNINNEKNWINLLQPVPIDITVNMAIIARFQSDVDQILSNFIPYTDPYFIISWKWPGNDEISPFEIRSKVKWNENISIQYPLDIANNASYWTTADTSFIIEGWMFKNKPPASKPIYTIDMIFSSVKDIEDFRFMKLNENRYNSDYFTISARPQFVLAEPFSSYINNSAVEKKFTIYGKMLDYTDSIFLSSGDPNMFDYSSTGDFISTGEQIIDSYYTSGFSASASYPPISGYELSRDRWKIIDKNIIEFSFTPKQSGIFDIILANEAGYGIMTEDTIRPTLNPYASGTDAYGEYIEYQYPCTSGLNIINI